MRMRNGTRRTEDTPCVKSRGARPPTPQEEVEKSEGREHVIGVARLCRIVPRARREEDLGEKRGADSLARDDNDDGGLGRLDPTNKAPGTR